MTVSILKRSPLLCDGVYPPTRTGHLRRFDDFKIAIAASVACQQRASARSLLCTHATSPSAASVLRDPSSPARAPNSANAKTSQKAKLRKKPNFAKSQTLQKVRATEGCSGYSAAIAMTGDQKPTPALMAAAHWLTLLGERGASKRTRQHFRKWYFADLEHAAAYDELAGTKPVFDDLFGALTIEHRASDARTPQRNARNLSLLKRGPAPIIALAASLILAILSIAVGVSLRRPATPSIYASGVGELRTLVFADGSMITLDAGSRVEVAYSADMRRVELISGRALFDIAHDESLPFVVDTELGAVRVLGTSFVVHVSPSKVRTSVLRGRVRGEPRVHWRPEALIARLTHPHARAIHASAGEEFSFERNDRGSATSMNSPFNPAQRLAWRTGMLAFDGEPLADAALEVTRHTGVSFTFDDPSLEDVAILAYFAADDADRFIDHLARVGVRAEATNTRHYRLSVARDDAAAPHSRENGAPSD